MKKHKVRKGDYPSKIAKQYGITLRRLVELNPGIQMDRLQLGQEIVVGEPMSATQRKREKAKFSFKGTQMTMVEAKELLKAKAVERGIPPAIAIALVTRESGWNPSASNRAGAAGLMQLMPDAAAEARVNPFDIGPAMDAGLDLLKRTHDALLPSVAEYNAKNPTSKISAWEAAIIGYHAGIAGTKRWLSGAASNVGDTSLSHGTNVTELASSTDEDEIVEQYEQNWTGGKPK